MIIDMIRAMDALYEGTGAAPGGVSGIPDSSTARMGKS